MEFLDGHHKQNKLLNIGQGNSLKNYKNKLFVHSNR